MTTLVLIASYFPIFLHLSSLPIVLWDEAGVALQSLGMVTSGNYFIPTLDGAPDHWVLKPPLVVWLQAIFMHLIGINELAVRLPSALAALVVVLLMLRFGLNTLNASLIGFVAAALLLVSNGYIHSHVSRTGDVDSMLVLWLTFYCLSYFKYLESDCKENKYLIATLIGITLGFYTKGISAFFPIPGLIIYSLLSKKLIKVLRSNRVYLYASVSILVCLSYYLVREYFDPGYLDTVYWHHVSRYYYAIEPHDHGFFFFFSNLAKQEFYPFFYLLLPASLILFLSKNSIQKHAGFFSIIFIISYLLVISLSETKVPWYAAPLYPFMCLLLAIGTATLFNKIFELFRSKNGVTMQVVPYFVVAVSLVMPYKNMLDKVTDKRLRGPYELEGAFMRHLYETKPQINSYIVSMQRPFVREYDQINFYTKMYQLERGHKILIDSTLAFSKGDHVLVCQQDVLDQISNRFQFSTLHSWWECQLIVIK